jgi:hypothetical protein
MLGPFSRLAEEAHQPLLGYNTTSIAGTRHGTPPILHDWTTNLLEGVLNWPLRHEVP